jgi:NADPH:quinone reductase-like Zn-dependent oxidoreductase
MKYKSVVLTRRGGPEVLQIQEKVLRAPEERELQIKVLACGVGRTDASMRYGYYPFAPKIPFVPGYEIVGVVTAIGSAVNKFKIGDTVAALTISGGYSEYIYLEEESLVAVPKNVSPDEAVAVVLNYCTAYQILHRVLRVKKNDKVLIIGASGGVGTALLDLGNHAGLKMYGTASKENHALIKEQGVLPLNYKSEEWMDELKEMEPEGLDYVIDGIGGQYIDIGFSLLHAGGKLVEYGYPNFKGMLAGLLKLKWLSLSPYGKKGYSYGISANYKKDKTSIHEDMESLFNLLKDEKIKPIIAEKLPILEAAKANSLLESTNISGKIVLVAESLNR